ncbi:MAG: hypothetical protein J6M02_00855 [Clostridia bacterium]|nr:hypothetical protein [Clostridia bacterium]
MKKFRNLLIVLIVVGLLAASIQVYRRVRAEQRNRVVEIVADLADFKDIALELNMPITEMANRLTSAGTTSIAISEETLGDMLQEGKILLYSGMSLRYSEVNFNNVYQDLAQKIHYYMEENRVDDSNTTIVITKNREDADFLRASFQDRFPNLVTEFVSEDLQSYAFLINRSMDKVRNVGLGLTDEDFIVAQSLGFQNIIPRIQNHEDLSFDEIDRIYEQLKKYKVKTVVFGGVTVLGHDYQDEENEKLAYIGEKFSTPGAEIITAIIEKPVETDLELVQRGIKVLSKKSNYVNTKVYSADASQLTRLKYTDLVDQWGRAISQRNVRVIYVRPLDKPEKTTTENLEDSLLAIREIKDRIEYMGMKLGSAKGLGWVSQNRVLQLLIAFGTMAIVFLLFIDLFTIEKKKWQNTIYILFGLGLIGATELYGIPFFYDKLGDLMNKGIAFVASIAFPSFAGLYLLEVWKKYFGKKELKRSKVIYLSVLTLVVCLLIAAIGGFYIGGLLSESKYILKLDVFRGVKLSFLLPILFFAFAYVIKCGVYCDEAGKPLPICEQFKKLMDTPILVKYGLAAVVLLAAFAIIVMRSGNTLVTSASSLELAFRNFLEKYLVARPRTKELVAFPVLMFVVYLSTKKQKEFGFLAMAVAMIGIENVINSFCHIRMPILVTGLSTIYSLIFAVIIGSIGIVVIDKVVEYFKKMDSINAVRTERKRHK